MSAPAPRAPAPYSGIALVGYRGTGKSTLGPRLARRLAWTFADTDAEVERRAGRSIPAIFARDGEPAFRDLEAAALADLTQRRDLILATGGGAILREASRAALRRFGLVVWLRADPAELARRLAADPDNTRPALTAAGTLAEIAPVLAQREPLYHAVADLIVDTDRLDPDAATGQILDALLQPRELPA